MGAFIETMLPLLPPMPSHEIKGFSNETLTIFIAPRVYDQAHSLPCYEFIITNYDFPSVRIHKTEYPAMRPCQVIAVNPGQPHSSTVSRPVSPYTPIFIAQEFVQDLAQQIFGYKDLWFCNAPQQADSQLRDLVNQFIAEASASQPGQRLILDSLANLLVISLFRNIPCNRMLPTSMSCLGVRADIQRAEEMIRASYAEGISLEQIARSTNYSSFHFLRLFKTHTGKTPFEYLLDLKVDMAQRRLANTDLPITEICHDSGFRNQSHFTTVFKRKLGITPSQYRALFRT